MSGGVSRREFVARGPVKGTDWCVLEEPAAELVAPGGVVLCVEGTREPHEDAARAAGSAWELLRLWSANRARSTTRV